MKQLTITYAESRRLYGRELFHAPSRFIREIPQDYLREVRTRTTIARPTSFASALKPKRRIVFEANTQGFKVGQRVQHPKFGEGVITNFEGQGDQSRVQVQFSRVGPKWLVMSYANLAAV